jgi:hypothetical protein
MARPSEYTEEIGIKICKLMTAGMSLRKICELEEMPCKQTVYDWMWRFEPFLERYVRAREAQMEAYAEELTDLADNASLTAEAINKARLQIDTRKWLMSKLKAKKYGDHATLEHTGKVELQQLVIQRTPKTIDHQPTIKELPVINIDNDQK